MASPRKPTEQKSKTKISGPLQRVWSLEDEVKLLNALIFCRGEYDVDPSSSIDLVHRHIHVNMHMGFSRAQVYEKIRRLRQKFEAAVSKIRAKNLGPSSERDQVLFQLSQKIWMPDLVQVLPSESAKEEKNEISPQEFPHLEEAVSLIMKEGKGFGGNGFLERGLKLLHPSKLEELEERWKAHFLEEMKCFMEECELKSELLKVCIEVLDSSESALK